MSDTRLCSVDTYVKVITELPGSGELCQVWMLDINGTPAEDNHHATPRMVVTDINRAINGNIFTGNTDFELRDSEISGWKDVPERVQDEMVRMAPDDVEIIGRDGDFEE